MKKTKPKNPHLRLERLFHEPNRLGIMSTLCGADGGVTFNDLKSTLDLTDGNLSRHLKALEESGAIEIEKTFERSKPRTTVVVTDEGRDQFIEYLKTLEEVLMEAARGIEDESDQRSKSTKRGLFLRKIAEA